MWPKLAVLVIVVVGSFQHSDAQSYEDKRCKCICPSLSSVLNNTHEVERMLIIENVPPYKCNCDGVILPRIAEKIKGKEQEFCPRCECKYENRNTAVIKVVVVIVIWVISMLSVYMLFLICLDPLLNKRVKANYQEHTNEDVSDDTDVVMPLLSMEHQQRQSDSGGDYSDEEDVFTNGYFSVKDEVTLSSSSGGGIGVGQTGGVGIMGATASSPASAGSSIHALGARGNVLNRVGHQQDKWKRQVREQRKNIYDRHTMLN